MEPSHLSDDELQYELNIRGIHDITDKRLATRSLRIDLNDELKGLKPLPNTKLSPLRGQRIIESIEKVVSGLLSELSGAKIRKDKNAEEKIKSKLIHYSGKVERLNGSDPNEVKKIENMQCEIMKALKGAISKVATTKKATNVVPRDAPIIISEEGAASIERMATNESETEAGLIDLCDEQHLLNAIVTRPNSNENEFSNRPNNNENLFSNRSPIGGASRPNVTETARNTFVGVPDFDDILNNVENEGRNENENRNNGRNNSNVNLPEYDSRRNYDFPRANRAPAVNEAVNSSVPRNSGNFTNAYARNSNFVNNNRPANDNYHQNRDAHNNYHRVGQGRAVQFTERIENMPRRRNPIAEWNITFSGESKETSLNDFLSQVALLARAERVSDEDLLRSAVYLFKGAAYTWYRAFHPYYETWGQLVSGLKSQFLPVDYDFWLLKELEQRRQGETENFGIFFAAMEMLFRNLSYRLAEPQKLQIVMRNMHPMYVDRLSLENIVSLPQLAEKCKRIEQARYRVGRQVAPQISRRDLLEPAFAYQGQYTPRHRVAEIETYEVNEPDYFQLASVSNSTQNIRLCYNCGEQGHRFNQCNAERKLFCYKCGASDCVVRTCNRCQNRQQGNETANSYRGRQSSQDEGIRAPKF